MQYEKEYFFLQFPRNFDFSDTYFFVALDVLNEKNVNNFLIQNFYRFFEGLLVIFSDGALEASVYQRRASRKSYVSIDKTSIIEVAFHY